MSNESSEEPKLIIDEDWKTQVEREKEELKRKQAQGEDASAAEAAPPQSEHSTEEDVDELPPPPPASLPFLITSLATQAMASLGQIPDDDGNPLPVQLSYARHFIDLIGIIEEKTRGNLTDEESRYLQETLHQMRMMFLAVSQQKKS